MFYRDAGQFKTNYAADMAVFPLREDRIGMAAILVVAFVVLPLVSSDYVLNVVMIPFLIYALAAIGLNVLVGYAGLLSLGTGGFMGVGAYACYKLTTLFPDISIAVWILVSGVFSSLVGIVFGLPSLRIKGFYLAVATLAAQFFLSWAFQRVPWLYNDNISGAIEVPTRTVLGIAVTGPNAAPSVRYLVVLGIVSLLTLLTSNVVHGRIGRMWMAVRDMDIAAQLIGIRLLRTKLLAFAVSSYLCGVAGALLVFLWYGSAEPDVFSINLSFLVVFMVILGGLGSLLGSFLGAGLIYLLPIGLKSILPAIGLTVAPSTVEHINLMIVGALIIAFLIAEPHGLARLWQTAKQKLRMWPFPY